MERLQDIDSADYISEGLDGYDDEGVQKTVLDLIEEFKILWNSINANPKPVKRGGLIVSYVSYPWEEITALRLHRGKSWRVIGDPWVWVISFKEQCIPPKFGFDQEE